MKMNNIILLAIGGIGFSLFMIWELSLQYGFLQVIGALAALIGSALILNYLMKGKESSEDDFERAEKIAEDYVERKTGIKATYIRSKGTTVELPETEFAGRVYFVFVVYREKHAKPYLMVIEKFNEKFKKHSKDENPSDAVIRNILSERPDYSFLFGVPIEKILIRKRSNAPTNQIIVGGEKEDKEKRQEEKMGLK